MIIAIDGPAGAGKSTVCRKLAEVLGFVYLDSGAMYRAVAWGLLREGIESEMDSRVPDCLRALPLSFELDGGLMAIYHAGKKLEEELREPSVTHWSSRFATNAAVRKYLTSWQRRLADRGDIVAEGRDMASVVFPDAAVKVFLTADLETRAKRRFEEYKQKKIKVAFSDVRQQIMERDRNDRERALAPLKATAESFVLDTSRLSIEEVVAKLLEHIGDKQVKTKQKRL